MDSSQPVECDSKPLDVQFAHVQRLPPSMEAQMDALARRIGHPFALSTALIIGTGAFIYRGEPQECLERVEEGIALANEQGLPHLAAQGTFFRGWAVARLGRPEYGIKLMHEGVGAWEAIGGVVFTPFCHCLIAEAYLNAGDTEAAKREIGSAEEIGERNREHMHMAEILRIKGEILLDGNEPDVEAAEAAFFRSMNIAKEQEARLFELRTATSIARLWSRRNRAKPALEILGPILNWFTEGRDTEDILAARRLVDSLA